jgi:ATP-dependent helicase HrpB
MVISFTTAKAARSSFTATTDSCGSRRGHLASFILAEVTPLDDVTTSARPPVANQSLPIWQIHVELVRALTQGNRLVLVAPTGSGKTTQVPQMLLDAGLAGLPSTLDSQRVSPRKIVVLQPRRVAARTVAARVAWERGGRLGEEVGYQIRFDDQTGLGTRICFVTEGILLRWLQDDPTLADVAIILFDEFHERNLLGDVALALTKQLQATARPDLKLAVMSATLDAEPVAQYLGDCPVLISEGQSWPVETRFLDYLDQRPTTELAADAVEQIVNSGNPGDVLVFMPGMAEINATIRALGAARLREPVAVLALHGDLTPEEQDRAFAPSNRRKVVVATNVAETSVTIAGICHVVDSGQARMARYDAERGISTLTIEPISRASADQRKGRAGRTAPGTCYRLWTESGQLNRPERNTPEIQRSDLAEVVLLLHSLGIQRAVEFDWLDKPDPQAVNRAERLLVTLGAVQALTSQDQPAALRSPPSTLTDIGRQMLRLPMHPRYSRMLVEATKRGCVRQAALCAALVSGRDLLMRLGRDDSYLSEARELFETSAWSDFFTLMSAHEFAKNCNFNIEACRRYGIHAQTVRQVEQTFEQILAIAARQRLVGRGETGAESSTPIPSGPSTLSSRHSSPADESLLRCLLVGFADQLCIRRDLNTLECEMTEGRTGTLMRESVVHAAPLFVTASIREVSGRASEPLTLLGLASVVKHEWVEEMFPKLITSRVDHLFDRTHKRVAALKRVRFLDLVIHQEHQREVDPAATGQCLAEAYRKGCFELPLFNHQLKQFIARVNLVCAAIPQLDFPPLDEAAITACLARALRGITTVREAQAAELAEAFRKHLVKEQRAWLDELTPLTVRWPDGRALKLLYLDSDADRKIAPEVELQIKLHECFPLKEHPRLCEGRVAVKLWLCAPDGKRLEPTLDWPAFRASHYPKLKRALQQKYPGVAWL